ncbi:hypothetical protein [Desertibacillus haloalkaliphilus]|uniref:hypothetical protein n=1 Tax=Desertibacillus haloalkaliphilus TaxID=1328930 RepID=UPI001C25BDB7|nr:hypothetical protein [Desertibacillus haloalkaliphilus]MBU8908092.1 hypothetical protein [Desertibacillus haloalkaliphilus]
MNLILMILFGLFLYVFTKIMLKEPILPWKEKKEVSNKPSKFKKKKSGKQNIEMDQDPDLFKNLFDDVQSISHHMIRFKSNKFVMIAEVEPVNYFLLSDGEQEAIDAKFENWLATINYSVQFYLQNRYVDLSEPIADMKRYMEKEDDLPYNAREYGQSLIEDLESWQVQIPRYETKRFIAFPFQVNTNDITAEDDEEFEEKVIDKAFSELYRRYNTAKNSLNNARIKVDLLTNEGIIDVLYHAFNRRKAIKNKFKEVKNQEMLALYLTADQDEERIELVKEMIDREFSGETQNQEAI